ncbi:thermonuclease family protein [Phaeovibrio sulfidiphilus]|uniref:Thermonuclease family protein n=1 Tax=Phaeovibrio sulfidiphilus TaxID=1220600 RepID=A0A8J6YVX5_9PROT|nr:thermonuclease family protein [Phaeovibrio sulfidiphilus]MBE1237409.1 thermonuclease family protein [Phaeovibrio sulfidiphilus]
MKHPASRACLLAVSILCGALSASPSRASAPASEPVRVEVSRDRIWVIDGDTISLDGRRLRTLSIDTPEIKGARCARERLQGQAAQRRLISLVRRAGHIEIVWSGREGKYGRPLIDLMIDGKNVAETLLAEGLALPWEPGRSAWQTRKRHWCPEARQEITR